jgi:hypothetical protein
MIENKDVDPHQDKTEMRGLILVLALAQLTVVVAIMSACSVKEKQTPRLWDPSLPPLQAQFRSKELAKVQLYLIEAAEASAKSYEDNPGQNWTVTKIPRPSIGSGETSTIFISRADDTKKVIEVAVRGTSNIDDAYQDIQTEKIMDQETGTAFHQGFQTIAKIVYKSIREKYGKKIDSGYMLRLYGHSLGGAVASIVSMYFHQHGATVEFVGTFGAPRFTNNEGARKFQLLNQVTYRIVRCDDAIPFMPPPSLNGWSNDNYEANGNVVLLMQLPHFDYSERVDIERDFSYQLRIELENVRTRKGMANGHRMSKYLDLTTRLLYSPTQLPMFYTQSKQLDLCTGNLEEMRDFFHRPITKP